MLELLKEYVPKCEQEKNDLERIEKYETLFDNLLSRDNDLAHYTSSAFIINKEKTKVLLIHHKIYDSWGWTGGHMDEESDFKAVALKEAQEETGISDFKFFSDEVASVDVLPVVGHVKNKQWVSPHFHLSLAFVLVADEKAELIKNEDETNGVEWFSIDELEKVVTEKEMLPIYQKIIDFIQS